MGLRSSDLTFNPRILDGRDEKAVPYVIICTWYLVCTRYCTLSVAESLLFKIRLVWLMKVQPLMLVVDPMSVKGFTYSVHRLCSTSTTMILLLLSTNDSVDI